MESLHEAVASLERRLADIEERLGMGTRVAPPTAVSAPPPKAPAGPAVPSDDTPGVSRFLGVLAVLCFVLAAGFLVKLSLESGWLTPWRQVALAAGVGASLILFGFRLVARGGGAYETYLPAAGVAILYLSAALGYFVHHLYGPYETLALTNGVSFLCLVLPALLRVKAVGQESYGVVAVLGSYFGGFALWDDRSSVPLITALFFSWAFVFTALSVFLKNRSIALVAAYLGLGLYHSWIGADRSPELLPLEATFQGLQFLVFAIGLAAYARVHRTALKASEAWSYFPVLFFFYFLEYGLLDRIVPAATPWVAVGSAAILVAIYRSARAKQGSELASGSLVSLYASLVGFHALFVELLGDRGRLWIGPVLLLASGALVSRIALFGRHFGVGLFLTLALLGSLGAPVFNIGEFGVGELALVHVATLAAAWALYRRSLSAAVGWTILFLAHFELLLGAGRGLSWMRESQWLSAEVFPFLLSALWGVYSVVVLALARQRHDKRMALSSLAVLLVAVVKLFLFDVGDLTAVVRVLCFLVMGSILYLCGFVLKNVNRW